MPEKQTNKSLTTRRIRRNISFHSINITEDYAESRFEHTFFSVKLSVLERL